MATILSRSKWTSTSARGVGFTWSRMRGIVCHYPAAGKDIGVLTQAQEASRLRGWRNYHVSGRGWVDIGYNYGIGQSGRIYSLRGNRVGAHAGGHNSTTVGVLFMVGDNEALTPAAKKAFKSLRAYLRNKGAGSGVWGHQQMSGASTRCPGPYIMGSIRDGSLKAGTGGGAAKPGSGGGSVGGSSYESASAKHAVGSRVMRKFSGGTDVNWLQRRLYKLGYKIDTEFDSLFGTEVEKAVRALQKDAKLKEVDGEAGNDTIRAAKAGKVVRELPVKKKAKKKAKPKPKKAKLVVDGALGVATKRALQRALGVTADAIIGRNSIKALQRKVGAYPDGVWGRDTTGKLQRKLKVKVDKKMGPVTVKALQRALNAGSF